MTSDLENVHADIQRMASELDDAREKVVLLSIECERLRTEGVYKDRHITELMREIEDLKNTAGDLSELRKLLDQVTGERDHLGHDLQDRDAQIAAMFKDLQKLDALKLDNQFKDSQLGNLNNSLERAGQETEGLNTEIDHLIWELHEAKNKTNRLTRRRRCTIKTSKVFQMNLNDSEETTKHLLEITMISNVISIIILRN